VQWRGQLSDTIFLRTGKGGRDYGRRIDIDERNSDKASGTCYSLRLEAFGRSGYFYHWEMGCQAGD
jgi:hypothetical protein